MRTLTCCLCLLLLSLSMPHLLDAVEETTEITDVRLIEERLAVAAEGLNRLSQATDRTTDSLTPENLDPANPRGQRSIAAHSRHMIDAAQQTAEAITGAYTPIQNTINQLLDLRSSTLRASRGTAAEHEDQAIVHMERQSDELALQYQRALDAEDTFLAAMLASKYANIQALIAIREDPQIMGIDASEDKIAMLEQTILNLQEVLDNSIEFVANLQNFSRYASNLTEMLESMADTNEVLAVLRRVTSGAEGMNISRLNGEMAQLNRQVLTGMKSLNQASNLTRQQMQGSRGANDQGRSTALAQEIQARAARLQETSTHFSND